MFSTFHPARKRIEPACLSRASALLLLGWEQLAWATEWKWRFLGVGFPMLLPGIPRGIAISLPNSVRTTCWANCFEPSSSLQGSFSLTSCHENQQKTPLPISICTSTCASKSPHFCLVGLLYFLGSMARLNLPIFSKQRLETPHVLSIASHLSASSGDLQQQIWRPIKVAPVSLEKKTTVVSIVLGSFWKTRYSVIAILFDGFFSGWKTKLQCFLLFFPKGHHVWVVFKTCQWRHDTFNMQALGYPFRPDFMTCQTHARFPGSVPHDKDKLPLWCCNCHCRSICNGCPGLMWGVSRETPKKKCCTEGPWKKLIKSQTSEGKEMLGGILYNPVLIGYGLQAPIPFWE